MGQKVTMCQEVYKVCESEYGESMKRTHMERVQSYEEGTKMLVNEQLENRKNRQENVEVTLK